VVFGAKFGIGDLEFIEEAYQAVVFTLSSDPGPLGDPGPMEEGASHAASDIGLVGGLEDEVGGVFLVEFVGGVEAGDTGADYDMKMGLGLRHWGFFYSIVRFVFTLFLG
jgi:hypothetical protein